MLICHHPNSVIKCCANNHPACLTWARRVGERFLNFLTIKHLKSICESDILTTNFRACVREMNMLHKHALPPAPLVEIYFYHIAFNIFVVWLLFFFSRSNNAVEDDGEDYLKGLDVDDRGGRGNLCPDEGGFHTEESRLPAIIRSRDLVSNITYV